MKKNFLKLFGFVFALFVLSTTMVGPIVVSAQTGRVYTPTSSFLVCQDLSATVEVFTDSETKVEYAIVSVTKDKSGNEEIEKQFNISISAKIADLKLKACTELRWKILSQDYETYDNVILYTYRRYTEDEKSRLPGGTDKVDIREINNQNSTSGSDVGSENTNVTILKSNTSSSNNQINTSGSVSSVGDWEKNGLVPCGRIIDPKTNAVIAEDECGFYDLFELGENILQFLVYISVPIAGAMIAYAGFLYITAQGSEDKIKRATGIFTKVLVGFIIILSAWLAVYYLTTTFLKEDVIRSEVFPLNN